jgi:hypothetical protein
MLPKLVINNLDEYPYEGDTSKADVHLKYGHGSYWDDNEDIGGCLYEILMRRKEPEVWLAFSDDNDVWVWFKNPK